MLAIPTFAGPEGFSFTLDQGNRINLFENAFLPPHQVLILCGERQGFVRTILTIRSEYQQRSAVGSPSGHVCPRKGIAPIFSLVLEVVSYLSVPGVVSQLPDSTSRPFQTLVTISF